jgi:hypothetical protein
LERTLQAQQLLVTIQIKRKRNGEEKRFEKGKYKQEETRPCDKENTIAIWFHLWKVLLGLSGISRSSPVQGGIHIRGGSDTASLTKQFTHKSKSKSIFRIMPHNAFLESSGFPCHNSIIYRNWRATALFIPPITKTSLCSLIPYDAASRPKYSLLQS